MVSWWHKRGIAFLKPLPGMSSGVGIAKSVNPRLRARISDLLQPPRINLTASAARMLSHILLMSTGKKGPNPEGIPHTPGKGRFCAPPAMWWESDGDIWHLPQYQFLGTSARPQRVLSGFGFGFFNGYLGQQNAITCQPQYFGSGWRFPSPDFLCGLLRGEKASYLVWKKAHIVLKASILLRTYKQTHPLTYLTNELSRLRLRWD